MPSIDALIGGFLWLAYRALMGVADIGVFAAILGLGSCVTAVVIGSLVWIIIFIIKVVKKLYDAVKAHYNRNYDCEYCIAQKNRQAPVQDDGPHITEEEAKESFDEDARTIVGEDIGKSSVELNDKANSEERNPLLRDDGEHTIKEDKETFHEDARMIVGEVNSKSSINLNEKANSKERNHLPKPRMSKL